MKLKSKKWAEIVKKGCKYRNIDGLIIEGTKLNKCEKTGGICSFEYCPKLENNNEK